MLIWNFFILILSNNPNVYAEAVMTNGSAHY